jgi:uncharacterized protein (DUF1330 family)
MASPWSLRGGCAGSVLRSMGLAARRYTIACSIVTLAVHVRAAGGSHDHLRSQQSRETAMRFRYAPMLAMLGGFGLGAIAVSGVQAQRTGPGAYVIVDITQINDPETFKTLLPKEPQTLAAFGGRFVTRTNYITGLDGVAPLRFVIIGFDSVGKAQEWNDSAAQTAINATRMKSTNSRSFIVEAEVPK